MSKVEVIRVTDFPQPEMGAPDPSVLAHEGYLLVYYHAEKCGYTAIIKFKNPYAHFFVWPGEESAHSFMDLRVSLPEQENEIINSDWSQKLSHGKFRHFAFVFHDSNLEILAEGYEVKLIKDELVDAVLDDKSAWTF